jgi:Fic family protein
MQIRAEFRDMPGMCVTSAQAARLWQLSREGAESVLREFVRAGFLVRVGRRQYRLAAALPASSKV